MIRRLDRWRRLAAGLLAISLLAGGAACVGGESPIAGHPTSIRLVGRYQTRVIALEIADEPHEHARGLSRRDHLAADHGMLFVFPDARDRAFWMKDTRFPLDIVFLDAERRIVGIVRRARPESEEPLAVGRPSRYVLEVEGGLMDRIGLAEGDAVLW